VLSILTQGKYPMADLVQSVCQFIELPCFLANAGTQHMLDRTMVSPGETPHFVVLRPAG
jgi:hypothetical protein